MPSPKSLLPRSLYGRAALILIVPVVAIQLVVSVAFIQRHFERVTHQMTRGIAIEVRQVLGVLDEASDGAAQSLARGLEMTLAVPVSPPGIDTRPWWDLSGRAVIATLRDELPGVRAVDLATNNDQVRLWLDSAAGTAMLTIDRRRVSATNPHQLLVLMVGTSILMTFIAFLFLRNQVRPISRLAAAAEAFGKGRHIPYKASGALEVRAAGSAFLDMRARIERQIEQRTLMLSGISHDLRTPLTRLRLGLAMLPEDPDTQALLGDVTDMKRLVDEFLSFARGDALEEPEQVDVHAVVRRVVDNAQRLGQAVKLGPVVGLAQARLRPGAVARAVENLIGNAVRHGTQAQVSVAVTGRAVRITVEDDGPGIPKGRRDEALVPFARLDGARDPNRGGGVGLGLAIATDVARSHGGVLRLDDSETLGGLKAELVLARIAGDNVA